MLLEPSYFKCIHGQVISLQSIASVQPQHLGGHSVLTIVFDSFDRQIIVVSASNSAISSHRGLHVSRYYLNYLRLRRHNTLARTTESNTKTAISRLIRQHFSVVCTRSSFDVSCWATQPNQIQKKCAFSLQIGARIVLMHHTSIRFRLNAVTTCALRSERNNHYSDAQSLLIRLEVNDV